MTIFIAVILGIPIRPSDRVFRSKQNPAVHSCVNKGNQQSAEAIVSKMHAAHEGTHQGWDHLLLFAGCILRKHIFHHLAKEAKARGLVKHI